MLFLIALSLFMIYAAVHFTVGGFFYIYMCKNPCGTIPQGFLAYQILADYSAAMTSTSHSTLLGSCFTATQERAGLPVKYFS